MKRGCVLALAFLLAAGVAVAQEPSKPLPHRPLAPPPAAETPAAPPAAPAAAPAQTSARLLDWLGEHAWAGMLIPVRTHEPRDDDPTLDMSVSVSLRRESWQRLPSLHPIVGGGMTSYSAGVLYAPGEHFGLSIEAMAKRDDKGGVNARDVAVAVGMKVRAGGG